MLGTRSPSPVKEREEETLTYFYACHQRSHNPQAWRAWRTPLKRRGPLAPAEAAADITEAKTLPRSLQGEHFPSRTEANLIRGAPPKSFRDVANCHFFSLKTSLKRGRKSRKKATCTAAQHEGRRGTSASSAARSRLPRPRQASFQAEAGALRRRLRARTVRPRAREPACQAHGRREGPADLIPQSSPETSNGSSPIRTRLGCVPGQSAMTTTWGEGLQRPPPGPGVWPQLPPAWEYPARGVWKQDTWLRA